MTAETQPFEMKCELCNILHDAPNSMLFAVPIQPGEIRFRWSGPRGATTATIMIHIGDIVRPRNATHTHMETMKFDFNNREHKLVADDLGLLLKMIDTGNIYKDEHSYYAGVELAVEGELKPAGHEHRKKDVAWRGQGYRTQNRVIVPVDTTSKKPMGGVPITGGTTPG
jgi:hypothetical protein